MTGQPNPELSDFQMAVLKALSVEASFSPSGPPPVNSLIMPETIKLKRGFLTDDHLLELCSDDSVYHAEMVSLLNYGFIQQYFSYDGNICIFMILPEGIRYLERVSVSQATVPDKDGPVPPDLLHFKGKSIQLSPVLWKLLNCIWDKKAVSFDDVITAVWGRGEIVAEKYYSLKSSVSRLNKKIVTEGISLGWSLKIKKKFVIKHDNPSQK